MTGDALPSAGVGSSAAAKDHSRFLVLDGMRGIAAIVVLIMHTSAILDAKILNGAYLAVDLFFLLSGFVLAHAYGKKLEDGLPRTRFMAIRLIRLYPLHFLFSH